MFPKSASDASFSPDSGSSSVSPNASGSRLHFDRYVLDLERGCLLADGREITLRRKTFEFLRFLAANSGRLVSKDELLRAVWPGVIVSDDSIVQCVTELRRALGDHDQHLIKTVQGRGYRFEARVSSEPRSTVQPPHGPCEDGSRPDKQAALIRRATAATPHLLIVVGALCLLSIATVWTVWWSGSASHSSAPPLSVVVLPFDNVGADATQQYFADGVSHDLSTELSRLPGFFVIAQATARTFKGKHLDPRQIGTELNVRYLLEGSVWRNGDQIRMNVQLISCDTGAAVWADRFERRSSELAAWQDEVIGRIATALNYRLTRLESARRLRENGGKAEVFDLTMRGWALVYTAKKPDHYFSAQALFQKALEREPDDVNALAGMAWTSAVLVLDGWSVSPKEDVAAAENAATRALSLDPNQFIAHHVRGFVLRMQRRSSAAREAFRTALSINPNFAPAHAQLGLTELELGRPEAAIPAVQRAIRLSPRDPALGPWFAFLGMAELHLGNHQEAVSWFARAVDTGTPILRHHAYFASALALAGRLDEARTVLADFRKKMPSASITSLRANTRSTDPAFIAQQEQYFQGLRIAGLPE